MKFQMVAKDGWREFDSIDDVIASGLTPTGTSRSYADILAMNPKAAVPRPMLWEQPTFAGWIGPMYGGPDTLRYETQEAYDLYSA